MDFIRAQQVARGDEQAAERASKRDKLGGAMKGIVGQSYNTAVVNDPELTGMQSAQASAKSAADVAGADISFRAACSRISRRAEGILRGREKCGKDSRTGCVCFWRAPIFLGPV